MEKTRVNIWKRKLEYPSKKKNKDLHKNKTKTQKSIARRGTKKEQKWKNHKKERKRTNDRKRE